MRPFSETLMFKYALAFFIITNLADWYTTKRIVIDKGTGKELNPVARWFMAQFAFNPEIGLAFLKVLIMGPMIWFAATYDAPSILWVVGSIVGAAAISNKFNLLGRARRAWRRWRSEQ